MALNVKEVSIIRESDDKLAKARVSLGSASLRRGEHGIYVVFRGDPAAVVELLETAAELARQELPEGRYQDRRGRRLAVLQHERELLRSDRLRGKLAAPVGVVPAREGYDVRRRGLVSLSLGHGGYISYGSGGRTVGADLPPLFQDRPILQGIPA